MRETEIELRAPDGATILGTLAEPDEVTHTCLFLHGLTGTRAENGLYTEAAAYLAERHVASLRIDFRGHGQSPEPLADFSPITQIIDTKTAVRWLCSRFVSRETSIIGMSFGALPGVFASLDMPEIARLCLFVPVLDYRRTFLEPEAPRMAQRFTPEAIARAERDGYLPYGDKPFRIALRLIEELRRLDPLAALRASPAAITIIHGDADPTVPYAVSAELAAADPRLIFYSMPGMGHSWKDIDDPEGVTERSRANKAKVLAVFGEVACGIK
jgi:pimeloyl-ACP methyl ester carboxylesterase